MKVHSFDILCLHPAWLGQTSVAQLNFVIEVVFPLFSLLSSPSYSYFDWPSCVWNWMGPSRWQVDDGSRENFIFIYIYIYKDPFFSFFSSVCYILERNVMIQQEGQKGVFFFPLLFCLLSGNVRYDPSALCIWGTKNSHVPLISLHSFSKRILGISTSPAIQQSSSVE